MPEIIDSIKLNSKFIRPSNRIEFLGDNDFVFEVIESETIAEGEVSQGDSKVQEVMGMSNFAGDQQELNHSENTNTVGLTDTALDKKYTSGALASSNEEMVASIDELVESIPYLIDGILKSWYDKDSIVRNSVMEFARKYKKTKKITKTDMVFLSSFFVMLSAYLQEKSSFDSGVDNAHELSVSSSLNSLLEEVLG